ncbi:MAG: DUF1566 domain-containing protein [Nitrospirae bacterium]|nr:DUF1566 domain-containing protein [Nitrospirota bacterium]
MIENIFASSRGNVSTKRNLTYLVFLTLVFFSIAGISYADFKVGIPKTGETTTNGAGSDGVLKKGVAWPGPRFTASNGAVTDNLTGLVWLQDANCYALAGGINKAAPGSLNWADALTWTNSLASGACGLSDGSAAGDWRLPNINELNSLMDASRSNPALPAGHPFTGVQADNYWSSTTPGAMPGNAMMFHMGYGDVNLDADLSTPRFVLPVRGGQ